jgi:LPS export ABC transporter protein LptC
MINKYNLLILLPILILGCTPKVVEENKLIQKINSLDMNIFSKSGDIIYSVTSPSSSYDNDKQKFQLKKTTINIFKGEETKYTIYSDESTLSDNNKILELKGNVKLKAVNKNSDTLFADYFIWNIKETNYLLEGNIRFENKNIILMSGKAILGQENIIEFFNPVKYTIKGKKNNNKYEINSENAFYDINAESVSFRSNNKKVRSVINF